MTVLVIGAESTGTSIAAGMLQRLGVDMGAREDPDQIWTHPRGNIEDLTLNDLLSRFREQGGLTPQDQVQLWSWSEERARGAGDRPWGAKHPYISIFAPFIVPLLDDVRFVVTLRPLRDTAESLNKKGSADDLDGALQLADAGERQTKQALSVFPDIPRLPIHFEDALTSPRAVATSLAAFLDLGDINDNRIASAANFVQQGD